MIKIESMEKEFHEMLQKKQDDEKKILDEKISEYRTILIVKEFLASAIGYCVIWYHLGIWVTLGLWLVLWGNSHGMLRNIFTDAENKLKFIWKYKK